MDESAGNGDALHLASRELMRHAVREVGKFDGGEAVQGQRARVGVSGEKERKFHVFDDAERVQQLKGLEDEANFFAAQLGELGLVEFVRGDAVEHDVAGSWKIHGAGKIEERGLAAAAAADKGYKFARGNLNGDIIEGANGGAIGLIVLGDALDQEDWGDSALGRRGRR